MKDKLRRERKILEGYRDRITSKKNEVDIIDTEKAGECLGFTYINSNGVLIYIYYHEPSLCFCIHDINSEPREIALNQDYE